VSQKGTLFFYFHFFCSSKRNETKKKSPEKTTLLFFSARYTMPYWRHKKGQGSHLFRFAIAHSKGLT
jgi:hypothetical protein